MAAGPNAKQKSTRGKRAGPKLWVAEWTIEQTTTPGHVNVSFGLLNKSDVGTSRSTTRHFLLRRDQADQLISELKEALANAAPIECVEKKTRSAKQKLIAQPGSNPDHADVDDTEPPSDHFALGVYGLVGN
jgi:hypothetical protein